MKVKSDDAIIYLLKRCLTLDAKVIVLESAVVAHAEKLTPGCRNAYLKSLENSGNTVREELLLNHPFLQDDFDDLLGQL